MPMDYLLAEQSHPGDFTISFDGFSDDTANVLLRAQRPTALSQGVVIIKHTDCLMGARSWCRGEANPGL